MTKGGKTRERDLKELYEKEIPLCVKIFKKEKKSKWLL